MQDNSNPFPSPNDPTPQPSAPAVATSPYPPSPAPVAPEMPASAMPQPMTPPVSAAQAPVMPEMSLQQPMPAPQAPVTPPMPPMPAAMPAQPPVMPQTPPVVPPPTPPQMPPAPAYQPLTPKKKGSKVLGWIVAIVAIVIILALAFLLYYYATKSGSAYQAPQTSSTTTAPVATPITAPVTPPANATSVISFQPPATLPTTVQQGYCWINSIAAGQRTDAWRCMVGSTIYDPCFQIPGKAEVYCQMNPTIATSFVISLTKPLPATQIAPEPKNNWAWFLTLADGTICSPFTGTLPSVNGASYPYGCKSPNKTQMIYLTDLTAGPVWTTSEVTVEQQGTKQTIVSQATVNLKTVWQ